jgi:hypothetical protein
MKLKLQLAGTGLGLGALSFAFFSIRDMNPPLSQIYAALDFFGTACMITAIGLVAITVIIAELEKE